MASAEFDLTAYLSEAVSEICRKHLECETVNIHASVTLVTEKATHFSFFTKSLPEQHGTGKIPTQGSELTGAGSPDSVLARI